MVQDTTTGQERDFFLDPLDVGPKVRWSPDDRVLGLLGISQFDYTERFRSIDSDTAQLIRERSLGGIDELGEVWDFDWLTDDVIVFLRRGQIRLLDLEKGLEQVVYANTSDDIRVGAMKLSPDRTQLLLTMREGPTFLLSVMPATGGELRPVYQAPTSAVFPTAGNDWSADGRDIFFTVRDTPSAAPNGRQRLWRVAVDGGEPSPLDLSQYGMRSVEVHPDGDLIAFEAGNPSWETWVLEGILTAVAN